VYKTVIPKVTTRAIAIYMLSETQQKHIELGQVLLYSE
jgi:hypothetical protein